MLRPDVVQLRQFYSSRLGLLVREQLVRSACEHWPLLRGDLTLGLGYANPLIRHYLKEEPAGSLCVVSAMPSAQGALYWPSHQQNRAVLTDEDALPFANNVMNRIILLHALEHVDAPQPFLDELWRVLTPGGRMLVIVPNRRSIWASAPNTPFSFGRPYSMAQLRETLCDDLFTHVHSSTTLFAWPSASRSLSRLSGLFYRLGRILCPMMGGLIVMEVEKQIYATAREEGLRSKASVYIRKVAGQPAMSRDVR